MSAKSQKDCRRSLLSKIFSAPRGEADFMSVNQQETIHSFDSKALLCQSGPKKRANSEIILSAHDSRISQPTNLSLINDNNTLLELFSANGGCHQIHF